MESIYDWLLHNMGNEGNYLTILNVQRQREEGDTVSLDVMARTKEFKVLNLLIEQGPVDNEPTELNARTIQETYSFSEADQVITYLSEGKTVETLTDSESAIFQLFVLEPVGNSGDISFPPGSLPN